MANIISWRIEAITRNNLNQSDGDDTMKSSSPQRDFNSSLGEGKETSRSSANGTEMHSVGSVVCTQERCRQYVAHASNCWKQIYHLDILTRRNEEVLSTLWRSVTFRFDMYVGCSFFCLSSGHLKLFGTTQTQFVTVQMLCAQKWDNSSFFVCFCHFGFIPNKQTGPSPAAGTVNTKMANVI